MSMACVAVSIIHNENYDPDNDEFDDDDGGDVDNKNDDDDNDDSDDDDDDDENSQDAIGTASDCYDCICWVMESVGLGCPTA